MKNQVLVGYLKKIKDGSSQVRVHVKLYQKTLASLAKWSMDTKVLNMCLWQSQIFRGHKVFQHFYHVMSFRSINIVLETGKYHSWPNTVPFRVRSWGANTHTPGRIQVPVPALIQNLLLCLGFLYKKVHSSYSLFILYKILISLYIIVIVFMIIFVIFKAYGDGGTEKSRGREKKEAGRRG